MTCQPPIRAGRVESRHDPCARTSVEPTGPCATGRSRSVHRYSTSLPSAPAGPAILSRPLATCRIGATGARSTPTPPPVQYEKQCRASGPPSANPGKAGDTAGSPGGTTIQSIPPSARNGCLATWSRGNAATPASTAARVGTPARATGRKVRNAARLPRRSQRVDAAEGSVPGRQPTERPAGAGRSEWAVTAVPLRDTRAGPGKYGRVEVASSLYRRASSVRWTAPPGVSDPSGCTPTAKRTVRIVTADRSDPAAPRDHRCRLWVHPPVLTCWKRGTDAGTLHVPGQHTGAAPPGTRRVRPVHLQEPSVPAATHRPRSGWPRGSPHRRAARPPRCRRAK